MRKSNMMWDDDEYRELKSKLTAADYRELVEGQFLIQKKQLIVASTRDEFVRYCQDNNLSSRHDAKYVNNAKHIAGHTPDDAELVFLSYPHISPMRLKMLVEQIEQFEAMADDNS